MLQIELLAERAREHQTAMRAAAAARHAARRSHVSTRVWAGVLLIRLGRAVAGDERRIPAMQG